MNRRAMFVLLAAVGLPACQTAPPSRSPLHDVPIGTYSADDGTSFEKAIVIEADSDFSATRTEYAWIRQHFPGAKKGRQSLITRDKRIYDLLEPVLPDGSTRSVYFDITKTFGKQ